MNPVRASILAAVLPLVHLPAQSHDWCPGVAGPTRFGHGFASTIGGPAILFGGQQSTFLMSDTWRFSRNDNSWTQLSPATTPPGRLFPSMAAAGVGAQMFVLHGGLFFVPTFPFPSLAVHGDTWLFDGTNWVAPVPSGPGPNPPATPGSRFNATMAAIEIPSLGFSAPGCLLFGGKTLSVFAGQTLDLNDTWFFDATTQRWTQLAVGSSAPPARSCHFITHDVGRGLVLMFGGESKAPFTTPVLLGDTWAFDGANWQAVTVTGPAPSPRSRGGLINDFTRNTNVLFGGWNGIATDNQTWTFAFGATPSTGTWTRSTTATTPAPRQDFCMQWDFPSTDCIVHGGVNQAGTVFFADTDILSNATLAPLGSGCPGSNGVPALVKQSPPKIDTVFRIGANSLPFSRSGNATLYIGAPSGPISLAPLGMPGCTGHTTPTLPVATTYNGTSASFAVPIPNDPALIGVVQAMQALIADPPANAFGAVVSDALLATIH